MAYEILKMVANWARQQALRPDNGGHYREALNALVVAAEKVKTFQ